MDIKHIVVVGAGTMGNGIAQVCAVSGYGVTLIDVDDDILQRALQNISASVDKLHGKGRLTDQQQANAQGHRRLDQHWMRPLTRTLSSKLPLSAKISR